MKRWLWFFVPFTLVSGVGVAVLTWLWIAGTPCDSYTPVDFFDLEPTTRCVKTSGTAHYEVVVTQVVEGNGFFDDQTYYVYGLFPPGNTDEREIRVLVRTGRPAERYVSFEDMEIEGKLLPMDYRKIPFDTETRMGAKSNYFFSDRVLLLEPDRIAVDGEDDWVRPR
ncbi:MAG: hypothetical protein H6737_03950 [Alphaproteobacteria bacterium]|nr:hypothetical protein [Alphaproteobacteria bacterium]